MLLTATQTGLGWDVDETTGGTPVIARDGNGAPTGLVDPNTGQAVPPGAVLQTESGRKFALVAGVIRNMDDGQGWRLITDAPNHADCNIKTVSNDTTQITVDYSDLSIKNVISFIAAPDETLAKAGFFCGSSVGLTGAQIQLKQRKLVADYISYNGSAWASTNGVFTFAFSAGTLTLTHENVETSSAGIECSVTSRDGVLVPVAGSASATVTQVKFMDWAGALQTTESANMKAYVSRGFASAAANPNNVNNTTFASGNLWLIGVFELN